MDEDDEAAAAQHQLELEEWDISMSQHDIFKARQLRKSSTEAEMHLWKALRCRRLSGFKFKRQVPCGAYVADFSCQRARLIIEVDGEKHANEDQIQYDQIRTRFME